MSGNVFDDLKERGFIAQVSDEGAVRKTLGEKKITFYVGFDNIAISLVLQIQPQTVNSAMRTSIRPVSIAVW